MAKLNRARTTSIHEKQNKTDVFNSDTVFSIGQTTALWRHIDKHGMPILIRNESSAAFIA